VPLLVQGCRSPTIPGCLTTSTAPAGATPDGEYDSVGKRLPVEATGALERTRLPVRCLAMASVYSAAECRRNAAECERRAVLARQPVPCSATLQPRSCGASICHASFHRISAVDRHDVVKIVRCAIDASRWSLCHVARPKGNRSVQSSAFVGSLVKRDGIVRHNGRVKEQSMPLIPDSVGFQQRLGNLPVTTYQAGERVLVSGSRTERLLILKKGAVAIIKDNVEIAKVVEAGAVFGEMSVLLNQPHTADVCALEPSEFYIADAAVVAGQDPVILLFVVVLLARRLNGANQALIELKSQVQAGQPSSKIGETIGKIEELLGPSGASLVYAGYPYDPYA